MHNFHRKLPLQMMEFVVVAKCDNFYTSNSHEANQKKVQLKLCLLARILMWLDRQNLLTYYYRP